MQQPSIAALQAVLFAAPRPYSLEELANIFECTVAQIEVVLHQLADAMAHDADSGLQVDKVAHGYRLATKPQLGEYVSRVTEVIHNGGLSNAALEALAIVAYRQPITRVEIETIRGVRSDSAVNALLERGLIEEQGRKEAPGRPVLFGTSDAFLHHFGLNSVEELPPLEDEAEEKTTLPLED